MPSDLQCLLYGGCILQNHHCLGAHQLIEVCALEQAIDLVYRQRSHRFSYLPMRLVRFIFGSDLAATPQVRVPLVVKSCVWLSISHSYSGTRQPNTRRRSRSSGRCFGKQGHVACQRCNNSLNGSTSWQPEAQFAASDLLPQDGKHHQLVLPFALLPLPRPYDASCAMSETTTLSDADASVDNSETSNGIQLEVYLAASMEPSPAGSGSSSCPLLLQDLQKAVLVLKHLRKENRQLSKNFENVRVAQWQLSSAYSVRWPHLDTQRSFAVEGRALDPCNKPQKARARTRAAQAGEGENSYLDCKLCRQLHSLCIYRQQPINIAAVYKQAPTAGAPTFCRLCLGHGCATCRLPPADFSRTAVPAALRVMESRARRKAAPVRASHRTYTGTQVHCARDRQERCDSSISCCCGSHLMTTGV